MLASPVGSDAPSQRHQPDHDQDDDGAEDLDEANAAELTTKELAEVRKRFMQQYMASSSEAVRALVAQGSGPAVDPRHDRRTHALAALERCADAGWSMDALLCDEDRLEARDDLRVVRVGDLLERAKLLLKRNLPLPSGSALEQGLWAATAPRSVRFADLARLITEQLGLHVAGVLVMNAPHQLALIAEWRLDNGNAAVAFLLRHDAAAAAAAASEALGRAGTMRAIPAVSPDLAVSFIAATLVDRELATAVATEGRMRV